MSDTADTNMRFAKALIHLAEAETVIEPKPGGSIHWKQIAKAHEAIRRCGREVAEAFLEVKP